MFVCLFSGVAVVVALLVGIAITLAILLPKKSTSAPSAECQPIVSKYAKYRRRRAAESESTEYNVYHHAAVASDTAPCSEVGR